MDILLNVRPNISLCFAAHAPQKLPRKHSGCMRWGVEKPIYIVLLGCNWRFEWLSSERACSSANCRSSVLNNADGCCLSWLAVCFCDARGIESTERGNGQQIYSRIEAHAFHAHTQNFADGLNFLIFTSCIWLSAIKINARRGVAEK